MGNVRRHQGPAPAACEWRWGAHAELSCFASAQPASLWLTDTEPLPPGHLLAVYIGDAERMQVLEDAGLLEGILKGEPAPPLQ